MTISFQANAAGTAGQINIGATPVVNIPVASGLPFCKNKLFNGEVTRINQRNFDGNWAPKGTWAGGNTIAQQELCYGWDMWAKASATDMLQPIEAGNFRPSTVHTISGTGVTTRQETSPASGNWNIVVPQTARNVQVEEGEAATPFELRPIGFELTQCQRYYQVAQVLFHQEVRNTLAYRMSGLCQTMFRVKPICARAGYDSPPSPSNMAASAITDYDPNQSSNYFTVFVRTATATSLGLCNTFYDMSAVI